MNQDQWTAVDRYFGEQLLPVDPALEAALQDSANAQLPPANVTPNQGKLLQLLALTCGARHILEIGALGGYSTIWLARAAARRPIDHAGAERAVRRGRARQPRPCRRRQSGRGARRPGDR